MARAPSSQGKTRLASSVAPDRLRDLRTAFLADTLSVVASIPWIHPIVFVTPDDGSDEILEVFETLLTTGGPSRAPGTAHRGSAPPVFPQGSGDLGARMAGALRTCFDLGHTEALLVGTDALLMSGEHLCEAAALLRLRGGFVLGPADDGGYYLVGSASSQADRLDRVFAGVGWGSDTVLLDTMAGADRVGVDLCLIRGTYDVDTIEDLERLERDLTQEPLSVAPRVRKWFG